MDTWPFWREFVIFITFCELYIAEKDVLEFFQPKDENPNELNEFLLNVQQHKDDFAFIREAAQHQKTKKSVQLKDDDSGILGLYYDTLDMDNNDFKTEKKRHVHSNPNRNHFKYSETKPIRSGNKNRYRRSDSLRKRNFDYVAIEPRGKIGEVHVTDGDKFGSKYGSKFKKEALDLASAAVHRTIGAAKGKLMNMSEEDESDDYSPIDMGKSPIHVNRNEENDGNLKSLVEPGITDWDNFQYGDNNFEKVEPYEVATPNNVRNFEKSNTDQNFEKITNNPDGNNLLSVDAGQPDRIEGYNDPVSNGKTYVMVNKPISNTKINENYQRTEMPYRNVDNSFSTKRFTKPNFERIGSTDSSIKVVDNDFNNNNDNSAKLQSLVRHGFIEISKSGNNLDSNEIDADQEIDQASDRDTRGENDKEKPKLNQIEEKFKDSQVSEEIEEQNGWQQPLNYDDEKSNYQGRNVPLRKKRKFYSRRLNFVDDEMAEFEVNEDGDYDPVPHRARRDFLDALGMKNEDDYSEDNPYIKDLVANVTNIANDTRIKKKKSTGMASCQDKNGEGECVELNNTCGKEEVTETTTCVMSLENTASSTKFTKNDISDIKQVLEEPQLTTGEGTVEEGLKPEEKREKKTAFSEVKDFDDVEENDVRKVRDTSKELMANKILMERNRILNRPNNRFSRRNYPKERNEVRRTVEWGEDTTLGYDHLKLHRIGKKEDTEVETIKSTHNCIATTEPTTAYVIPYGQVVQQIDEENEKLAKVVNGRLASKIVCTVFDELKTRSDLKNKFYPGLSRKHVNFDGKVDFDVFRSNETHDDAAEARNLLDEITRVLNRLVITQVRRKLCQRLPDELRDFLGVIVNVKNSRNPESFVANPEQGNYLFEGYKPFNDFPFEVKQLQATLVALESLLLSYHKMNNDCQNRAEPVRDYIENHVDMLRRLMASPANSGTRNREVEKKRDTPRSRNDLIEKQLESVGLGKNHKTFVPNFDTNQFLKMKMDNDAEEEPDLRLQSKRETKFSKSEKYRKLQQAVQQIRQKRENNRKIGEIFGRKNNKANADLEVNFEKPLIYSLE